MMATNPHRILGVIWAGLCIYVVIMLAIPISENYFFSNKTISTGLFMLALLWVVYLIGAIASIFLFRGVVWARGYMVFISILSLALCGFFVVVARSNPPLLVLFLLAGIFSLVSLILLFFTKKYGV